MPVFGSERATGNYTVIISQLQRKLNANVVVKPVILENPKVTVTN